jgi:type IV pilus assembly protein PilB
MLSSEQKNKTLDILVTNKIIDEKTASDLRDKIKSGEDLFFLLKEKKIDEAEIMKAMAQVLNVGYEDVSSIEVPKEILEILPEDFSKNYRAIVFAKENEKIKLAMVDPGDLKAREALEYVAREKGLKIEYYIISEENFNRLLSSYSGLKTEVSEALGQADQKLKVKEQEKNKNKSEKEEDDNNGKQEEFKDAPVSKMISVILKHAVEGKASDVHIEPFSDSSRVRYRIDGVLHTSLVLPKYIHPALVSRIKVLSNLKIDETRIPQDGRIRLEINNSKIDFRVSTLPLFEQEKVVMRILDTSGGALTLDQLGFEGHNFDIIQNNITKPNGMFLVTGPTGSGKSTTLYSVLNILNKEDVNIVTLEDPVEYYLTGVNQSQIRPDVGLTFASGLRSILRQDPDIVMVGEIRDGETAELAIHASLTGHVVLSTLHTNDAFGSIPRLIDMKVEPYLLSSTLNVIIAQRLVRKVCGKCKEEIALPEETKKQVIEELKKIPPDSFPKDIDLNNLKFYRGKGCEKCDNTGYKGRVGIAEVLEINDAMKEIIYANKMGQEIKKAAYTQGMISIQQDGIIKALKGLTTIEEVMRATRES